MRTCSAAGSVSCCNPVRQDLKPNFDRTAMAACSWTPPHGPRRSVAADRYLRGGIAAGAVGHRLGLDRRLGVAGAVGGAGFEQVIARRGRPVPDPLPPGVDTG